MKIVKGTFGTSGGAFLSKDDRLVIEGAKTKNYLNSDITTMVADQEHDKRMSCLSVFFCLLITALLTLFLGIFGFIFGIVMTAYFATYKATDDFVEVSFNDGESVRLKCTPRQVKRLIKFNSA